MFQIHPLGVGRESDPLCQKQCRGGESGGHFAQTVERQRGRAYWSARSRCFFHKQNRRKIVIYIEFRIFLKKKKRFPFGNRMMVQGGVLARILPQDQLIPLAAKGGEMGAIRFSES